MTSLGLPRGAAGVLKFRDGLHRLREAIEGDLVVQVVNVVVADVPGQPVAQWAHVKHAGAMKGGVVVVPVASSS